LPLLEIVKNPRYFSACLLCIKHARRPKNRHIRYSTCLSPSARPFACLFARPFVCPFVRLSASSLVSYSLVNLFAVLPVCQPGHPTIRPAVRPSDRPSFPRCLPLVAGRLLFARPFTSLSYRMCRRSAAAGVQEAAEVEEEVGVRKEMAASFPGPVFRL
ncbi:hypothetical protein HOY82DRAFT_545427, partial [Tuber indicum]